MSPLKKDLPGWLQALLLALSMIIAAAVAMANASNDTKNLRTQMEGEVKRLEQNDGHLKESIQRIEQMLKEEFEQHHRRGNREGGRQ